MTEFPWPTPADATAAPVWTGRGFRIGTEDIPVLSYLGGTGGWTDELTEMHEEAGGADHPMNQASLNRAVSELKCSLDPKITQPIILEVGCSSGYLLPKLRKGISGARVIGSDFVGGPLLTLSKVMPEIPLLRFDLVRCPLPDACVDAVVLLNVLEHVPDHESAMKQLFRIVKPGGVVYIEVPAGPQLFDVYDQLLMHSRRYHMSALKKLLTGFGFEITSSSHLGFLCYPGFWWTKKRNKRLKLESAQAQQKMVSQYIRQTSQSTLLNMSLKLDRVLDAVLPLPWGIRCVVTCRKPLK